MRRSAWEEGNMLYSVMYHGMIKEQTAIVHAETIEIVGFCGKMVSANIQAMKEASMGNRILKETIRMSRSIDALSWFEEVLFYRLIVTVDDYGVCPADPVVLAHILFPRKENISRKQVAEALDHLEQAGLIRRYEAGDEGSFLRLSSWEKHQRLRNSRRIYPLPEEAEAPTEKTRSAADSRSEAYVPENPPVSERERAISLPPAETPPSDPPARPTEETIPAAPEPAEPCVIELPLNDGSSYRVSVSETDEFRELYPAVDVMQELRNIRGWLLANEKKRKTRNGILRFINSWLSRTQNRGGSPVSTQHSAPMDTGYRNPFAELVMQEEGGSIASWI